MSKKRKLSDEFSDEDNKIFLYILLITVVTFFASIIANVVMTFLYAGDAAAGSIVEGHYYLGHGSDQMKIEVSWFIFQLSDILHKLFISSFILIVLFLVVIKLFGKVDDD